MRPDLIISPTGNLSLKTDFSDKEKCQFIPMGTFSRSAKRWEYPLDKKIYDMIKIKFPDVLAGPDIISTINLKEQRINELMDVRKAIWQGEYDLKYRHFLNEPFYDHQLKCFLYWMGTKTAADFSEPGCGKTMIELGLIKYRTQRFGVKKTLIISPKATLEDVWYNDIQKFLINKDFNPPVFLLNQSTDKCIDIFKKYNTGIFIINYEKVWRMDKSIKNFDFIICDESHKIKNPKRTCKQATAIAKLGQSATFKSIMTGTPAPNTMMELFNQIYFLSPSYFGSSFYKFRDNFFMATDPNKYNWVPKEGAREEIKSKIHPVMISFKTDDVLDLPEMLPIQKLTVEMNPDQQKAYDEMASEMVTFLDGNEYTSQIVLTKLLRLNEITSGFIQNNDEEQHFFKKNPKLNALKDWVETIPENRKIIIWAIFKPDIKLIYEAFEDQAVTYYGGNTDKEKSENLRRFKTDSSARIFISNPASGGTGLNLTVASYSMAYSYSQSFINHEQSLLRFKRPGQKHSMFPYFLMAKNSIDQIIYKSLQTKQKINDFIKDVKNELSK